MLVKIKGWSRCRARTRTRTEAALGATAKVGCRDAGVQPSKRPRMVLNHNKAPDMTLWHSLSPDVRLRHHLAAALACTCLLTPCLPAPTLAATLEVGPGKTN